MGNFVSMRVCVCNPPPHSPPAPMDPDVEQYFLSETETLVTHSLTTNDDETNVGTETLNTIVTVEDVDDAMRSGEFDRFEISRMLEAMMFDDDDNRNRE